MPHGWFVAGYAEAHDRFKAASQHPESAEGMYLPLFEALNWAGCLEEDRRPHSDPLLLAVRHARNRVVHQWADAVEGRNVPVARVITTSGAGAPTMSRLLGAPVVWDWFWRKSARLPAPAARFADPTGEGHYETLLADKPVRQTLEALRQVFEGTGLPGVAILFATRHCAFTSKTTKPPD